MNKQQLTIILESTILSFDGLTEQRIIQLNPEFDIKLIKIGIKLNKFLEGQVK